MVKKKKSYTKRKKTTRKKISSTKKTNLKSINKKMDQLLKMEAKDLRGDSEIKAFEKKQLKRDSRDYNLEKKQLEELEDIEKNLRKEIKGHPLKKITERDIGKGLIGAFAATVSHFVFLEGAHVGESLSDIWTLMLYLIALLLGGVMLYLTGFRTVKDSKVFKFIPIRLAVIYFVSLLTIVLVLFLYQQFQDLHMLYKQVGALAIPAMLGASIADLLGKEE